MGGRALLKPHSRQPLSLHNLCLWLGDRRLSPQTSVPRAAAFRFTRNQEVRSLTGLKAMSSIFKKHNIGIYVRVHTHTHTHRAGGRRGPGRKISFDDLINVSF